MKKYLLLAGAVAMAPGAFADLILLNGGAPLPSTGNGVGAVTTILSVTHNGSSDSESGCVTPTGINTDCPSAIPTEGHTLSGANSSIQPIPVGTMATDLRFLFNASETQGSAGSVTLNQLTIGFYDSTGLLLHAASFIGPTTLMDTLAGTGNAGFVFGLDATQAATVQTFLTAGTVMVGAGLSAGCPAGSAAGCVPVSGGPERVQLAIAGAGPGPGPSPVPEPGTLAMMGGGLVALGFGLRRRLS